MIGIVSAVFIIVLAYFIADPLVLASGGGFSVTGTEESENNNALDTGFRVTVFEIEGAVTADTVFPQQLQPAGSVLLLLRPRKTATQCSRKPG